MGGTRIVVLQLKQIIRMGIFVLVGLGLIIAFIWFLTPRDKSGSSALYIPGTYAAQIILHNKPVSVEVTVNETEITNVELKDMLEVQEVFYPLFKPTMESLSKEILQKQSTNVSTSADTAVTSQILLDAVNVALEQAHGSQTAIQ